LLIKYTKSVLWRVAKCLSYIEEVRCLKVKSGHSTHDLGCVEARIISIFFRR